MDDFLERLHAHDWAAEPQTRYNPVENVPAALEAAWRDEPEAREKLRNALCNENGDTWFPVLIGAMPFLAEIVVRGKGTAPREVMKMITYFADCFHVDFEEGGKVPHWERAFGEALEALRPALATIVAFKRADAPEAANLIDSIDSR
jgi:hypothetical protein